MLIDNERPFEISAIVKMCTSSNTGKCLRVLALKKYPCQQYYDVISQTAFFCSESFLSFLRKMQYFSFLFLFLFFFFDARRSVVFQPTCWKCMSDDNSILPVSESVPFKKQMRIFNAIFEKNHSLRPTHYSAIFPISDFCRWRCQSRHFVLRSFARMQKKQFLKNSH